MFPRVSWVILLVPLTCGLAAPSHGQTADPAPATEVELPAEVQNDSTAIVLLKGRELFKVGPLGIVNAQERAALISTPPGYK